MNRQGCGSIQMLMSDVDGTLVTPQKELTEGARRAVFSLRKARLRFTLISSRPPYGLKSLVASLRVDQPIVAFNGGMLLSPEGKPLETHFLQSDRVMEILDCLKRFGVSPRVYTSDFWLIPTRDQPYASLEACTIETEPRIVSDFSPYVDSILKITGVSTEPKTLLECQKAVERIAGLKASVACSQSYYLDITHELGNKGHALQSMAERLGISQSDIAVMGDMPSDLPMFREAGFSIAMGNASDTVKHQADYTTASNQEEGFARAIQKLLLMREASAIH